MLIEITGNEELKRLLGIDDGFLLNVDFPTNRLTRHKINCKFCDPESDVGVKPSSKIENKSGEFWFSNNYDQIFSKAEEFNAKGCTVSLCKVCNPQMLSN